VILINQLLSLRLFIHLLPLDRRFEYNRGLSLYVIAINNFDLVIAATERAPILVEAFCHLKNSLMNGRDTRPGNHLFTYMLWQFRHLTFSGLRISPKRVFNDIINLSPKLDQLIFGLLLRRFFLRAAKL
jgi:hypothetical protein